ncbi:flagellar motor protein MotB [Flavobacterium faecale]|uniref:Flagellar motor protein MotB n=1 Tax=Flavobacterium faecale TaxID=1355330 RepID=A0A2S1LA66_9FLAO|nr:OmpA family protein [Flavobacterium faecale]AWG20635.1 flagellar motor protein MotB [Flavobacterium faecale]
MKIKNILYGFCILLATTLTHAQKAKVAAANKQYERFSYIDAITTYERVAEKGYKDEKMFQKLGNAYYFNADLDKAGKWYEELFNMNPDQEAEYFYRYSQCLKSMGDYKKADKILAGFYAKSENDIRANLYEANKNYLEDIEANSGRFNIEDAGINSPYSDYGTAFVGNKLVFASARDTIGVYKRVFTWTNQSFTNLYSSEVNERGQLGEPKRFNSSINSKFHESTPIFTRDGKTMYFTRNNYLDGKKGKDSQKITLLKIYKATLEKDRWTNVEELPFNSNDYSNAHPALSTDDKVLYFASNMPGTFGQSDLFKVNINSDGTYSTPENLGKGINTEGRETFPFISDDNELYFASDGRPGLGGLDVYVTEIKGATFGDIQNVGEPINGPIDDFGFFIDSASRVGFFTSNRDGGHGYDDIYKFSETRKLKCNQLLNGYITDKESGQILENAKTTLFDDKFNLIKEGYTDADGKYIFKEVECGKTYYVRAEKKDYETNEGKIATIKKSGETKFSLALDKRIKSINVGTDLAKTLNIPIIYFDLDKSFIRKDAAFELEKVLAVMKEYPKMKVDIRSHTDCRQTAAYNEALSDRRAKSTRAWLIKNGIEASRLTAKGYGESQLINDCACEPTNTSSCTEEQHQMNRRSEFIIVAVD